MADTPENLEDVFDEDMLIVFRQPTGHPRRKAYRVRWSTLRKAIQAFQATVEGKPGASAYDVAVSLGFKGTASQWVASLKGTPGDAPSIRAGQTKTGAAGSAAKVTNSGTASAMVLDFEIPAGAKGEAGPDSYQVAVAAGYAGTRDQWLASLKGKDGAPAATPLGTITVGETIAVAIGQGVRRVIVTTPTAWGVDVGQNLAAFPVAVPSTQYAIHDVIATGKNTVSVGVSVPALALAATYSISCRLVRLPA